MEFNSFRFWIIFPLIFLLYWAIPRRWIRIRNIYLILVSYALYMNWKPAFVLVLLFITLITFYGARLLDSLKSRKRRHAGIAAVLIVLTAGPLLIFKYYNFLNGAIFSLLSEAGLRFSLPGLNWVIPELTPSHAIWHRKIKKVLKWQEF